MGDRRITKTQDLTPRQAAELASAKEVVARGLDAYVPDDVAGHSACRALVQRGLMDVLPTVRHERTGREGVGYVPIPARAK
jgi:hypothetical protein